MQSQVTPTPIRITISTILATGLGKAEAHAFHVVLLGHGATATVEVEQVPA